MIEDGTDLFTGFPDAGIAFLMAIQIIDFFQIIDITDNCRKGFLFSYSNCSIHLILPLNECIFILYTCERIDICHSSGHGKIQCVLLLFRDIYEDWATEDFYYVNSVWSSKTTAEKYDGGKSNVYLTRYEDIIGTNQSTGATVFLDASTNISNFLNDYKPKGFTQDTDFSGAFLYPDLLSRQQVSTDGKANDHVFIDQGESLSIPVVFEYFLDGSKTSSVDHTSVTKKMYFDIKNSLIKNPIHYMIEITGHHDFTSTGDIYSNFANIDLEDSVTNNS